MVMCLFSISIYLFKKAVQEAAQKSQKKLQTWLPNFYKAKCILVIGREHLLLI